MTTRWSLRRKGAVAFCVAMAMMLMMSGAAFAAGGPPAGRGGGNGGQGGGRGTGGGGGVGQGGGGGETTVSNNLSVPAVFVGGTNPFALTCNGAFTPPSGTPLTDYEVPGYYYVQGVHKWQAGCMDATAAFAHAAWGDNLTGSASLRVGSPVRVEVGLVQGTDLSAGVDTGVARQADLTGYTVIKLQPSKLDRESAYGTEAASGDANAAAVNQITPYLEMRVWDAGAQLSIVPKGTAPSFQAATAEINATGRVVYGFNWKPTAAGVYTITFRAPTVTITGSDVEGTVLDAHTVSLDVTISATAGGGGGGGGGH